MLLIGWVWLKLEGNQVVLDAEGYAQIVGVAYIVTPGEENLLRNKGKTR